MEHDDVKSSASRVFSALQLGATLSSDHKTVEIFADAVVEFRKIYYAALDAAP